MHDRDESKLPALHGPVDASRDSARPPGKATLVDRTSSDPSEHVADPAAHSPRQQFHTTRPGALYDDDGRPIASEVAHRAVSVRAGSIRRLVLHGEARVVECVHVVDDSGRSGWMPTSSLPSVVAREQRGGARRFRIKRDVDGLPKKKRRLIASSPDGAPDLDADGWALDGCDAFFADEAEHDGLVYGYVASDTGERIYGWIDTALLGDAL